MTLNESNLSDYWGWYVDFEIENNIQLQQSNIKKIKYNILDIIHEEDEYEYFKKNCKDLDFDIETLIEYSKENKQPNIQEKKENSLIYKVGSTTLITALLTYIVYFVL